MSSAVDIPSRRKNTPSMSEQLRNQPAPPINESMVRELLSVNLPNSFHYPNNPLETNHNRRQRNHRARPKRRSSSSSSSSSSRRESERSTSSHSSVTAFPRGKRNGSGLQRRSRPPNITTRSSSSSSQASTSSVTSASRTHDEDSVFYARFVKVDRGERADEPVALARCCRTVRDTLKLLEGVQTSNSEGSTSFFWLDLHGVPPPQRRQCRRRDRVEAPPLNNDDAPMSALWAALGMQALAMKSFEAVQNQRQAHPRPDRTLLDDVYEEEVIALTSPSDRVLHMEPLQAVMKEDDVPGRDRNDFHKNERSKNRQGNEVTQRCTSAAIAAGSTHYVVLEVATLLASIPTSAAMSEELWGSALFSNASLTNDDANEPLNDLMKQKGFERIVLGFSAAAASAHRSAVPTSSADTRRATSASQHTHDTATTPLIASTYVVCFPAGCVTWCPASTLGLTSADCRTRSSAEELNTQRREQNFPHTLHGNDAAGSDLHHTPFGKDDTCAAVQCVKAWGQLQTSVLSRMRCMAQLGRCTTSPTGASAEPAMCTSIFISLLLSSVCHSYLPNTANVLGEVDAIDSMLPLIDLDSESDQTDTLRRVLLLRRRLALHRRLLFQKICLLEALDRPVIQTTARFIQSHKEPAWATHNTAILGVSAKQDKGELLGSASRDGGNRQRAGTKADGSGPHATATVVKYASITNTVKKIDMHTPPGNAKHALTARRCTLDVSPAAHPMAAAAPSLATVYKSVTSVTHKLEVARTVLGNATLIYTSKVNFTNSRTSETADYFALMCQYMLLVMLPLNIVASHWGMNCPVLFADIENTNPFWGIVGVIMFIAVAGAIIPLYAYKTRKIYLIW